MSETTEQLLERAIGAILERLEAGDEITVSVSRGMTPGVSEDGQWRTYEPDGTRRFEFVCRDVRNRDRLHERFLAATARFHAKEAS